MTAVALTIAGSDSSGGAGIQADLKTFAALGVYGTSAIAALTAQNTLGVRGVHDVPVDFITAQIDAVFADFTIGAVKLGMLSQPAAIEAVIAAVAHHGIDNLVVDPVMVATSGARLLAPDAVALLRTRLIPRALIVTPNLPEAAALLDMPVAGDEDEMRAQGERLLALGPRAVLMKGGHASGNEAVDLLVQASGVVRLTAARVATANTHGTGCTLSAAIAAGLAKGNTLEEAVREAKIYVTAAIVAGARLGLGHGAGPLHHMHAWW